MDPVWLAAACLSGVSGIVSRRLGDVGDVEDTSVCSVVDVVSGGVTDGRVGVEIVEDGRDEVLSEIESGTVVIEGAAGLSLSPQVR